MSYLRNVSSCPFLIPLFKPHELEWFLYATKKNLSNILSAILAQKAMIKRPVTLDSKKETGKCLMCSRDATTEVIRELEKVQVVEKYCDLCLQTQELQ
jgi:hypothetical protein